MPIKVKTPAFRLKRNKNPLQAQTNENELEKLIADAKLPEQFKDKIKKSN